MERLPRRQFIASACAAALTASPCAGAPVAPHIGIEVYSLLQQIGKDPAATLKQVATVGFKTIELATFVRLGSPAEVRKMLDGAGLVCPSLHMRLTNKDLVKLELDCGWMIVAGFSPRKYLRKHGSRYQLLHIRDFQAGFARSLTLGPAEMGLSCPLGKGSIDYAPIFAAAKEAGVREYFVEQEPTLHVPLADSLRIDFDYMNRQLAA